ncbi:MerR family transcriptional regulator [Pectinatus haikarae]|uniref:DNA-binding transcriptional MerR regulator n=1 Tax=Pectinatus haikarae TaxID=349096 RepID=A0ABT9Y454_9FIRM|nr:MerR family transcriptional regulator [Pectinatus haikarae]MDQ0202611.1 DNA-binding transcriptional MerR regulator [Pectinatus haikarae]
MTISEVSEKYGMTQDTLRYYERVGLIPSVPRKPSGVRDYDEHSCGWVEFIRCMRSAGLPVETLIEYVRLWQEGSKTKAARKHLLIEEKKRLDKRIAEMQATQARLASKIAHYDNMNRVAETL